MLCKGQSGFLYLMIFAILAQEIFEKYSGHKWAS